MSKPVSGHDFPYKLLRYLYFQGGQEMRAVAKVPVGVTAGQIQLADEEASCVGSSRGNTWSAAEMERLVRQRFVSAHKFADGVTAYRVTPSGLMALRMAAEDEFCRVYGSTSVSAEDVIVSRAMVVGGGLSGHSLDTRFPRNFIEQGRINVWGQVRGTDEPFLLAKAQMYFIDAEAALHLGGFTLGEVIHSHPETSQYHEMICNHALDGEPATHIYELTEMFGLEEAIGRQLIILHDLRVSPAFIGKGMGREIAKRLFMRYGVGGGLAIIPLRPYGTEGDEADQLACRHLARTSFEPYIVQHPFVSRTLVGDIRKISRLP
jgi:hypothetical protein